MATILLQRSMVVFGVPTDAAGPGALHTASCAQKSCGLTGASFGCTEDADVSDHADFLQTTRHHRYALKEDSAGNAESIRAGYDFACSKLKRLLQTKASIFEGTPEIFTARVQWNSLSPGPGSATYRNITSYWVYDGPSGQERYTSLEFMRGFSSGASAHFATYDSVTSPSQCQETTNDMITMMQSCATYSCKIRLFTNYTSISRFLPYGMSWAGDTFPETPLTYLGDVNITGRNGTVIECQKFGWTGDWGASHEVWIAKVGELTGLVLREIQTQGGGPNPYPSSADVTIEYDALLTSSVIGMPSMESTLFNPVVLPGCRSDPVG